MKLLHKVVKSSKINLSSDTVGIENTIILPPKVEEICEPDEVVEEVIDYEGIAREKADAILKAAEEELSKAKEQASNIIESANEQAEQIRKDAFNEGYTDGTQEATNKCESYIRAAAELISGINSKKDALFKRYEKEILDTTLDIAQKITIKIADNEKEAIVEMIKSAAKHFRNSDHIKLTLSDVDVAAEIISDKEFLSEILGGIPHIETELISGADGGTLILDNGSEIIDASVSTQLNMIKEIASK